MGSSWSWLTWSLLEMPNDSHSKDWSCVSWCLGVRLTWSYIVHWYMALSDTHRAPLMDLAVLCVVGSAKPWWMSLEISDFSATG